MTTEASNAETEARISTLETRLKALERALMTEKRRGDNLQQMLESGGLSQLSDSYDKAFSQASQSYQRIIEEALVLGHRKSAITPALPPSQDNPETVIGHVANIFDDLPKILSAVAIVISLIAGSTSITSLLQIDNVNTKAELAAGKAENAQDTAKEAKIDAEFAKENATQAQLDAEFAKDDASEAKEKAVVAQQEAEQATQNVQQVEEKVKQAVEDAQTTNQ